MKPEQQRIELARIDGWEEMWTDDRGNTRGFNLRHAADGKHRLVPDYLNDLNAVHELERGLRRGQGYHQLGGWGRYLTALADICAEQCPIDATAAQRCEAILRVKGMWK